MNKLKKPILILPDHKKRWILYDLIDLYARYFSDILDCDLEFHQDNKVYSIIAFRDGKFKNVISQESFYKYPDNDISCITDLSIVRKEHLTDALKGYFVLPADEYGNSCFNLKMDLEYNTVQISDMKAITYQSDIDPSVKRSLKLSLPPNLQARLNTIDYAYHGFKITYHQILDALNNLAEEFYIHLHLWYFHEMRLPNHIDSFWRTEYKRASKAKSSTTRKKYYKVRRLRDKSLKELCSILVRG